MWAEPKLLNAANDTCTSGFVGIIKFYQNRPYDNCSDLERLEQLKILDFWIKQIV